MQQIPWQEQPFYIADNNTYLGSVTISDTSGKMFTSFKGLKGSWSEKAVMLTGDKPEVGKLVGEKLGLDEVHWRSSSRR